MSDSVWSVSKCSSKTAKLWTVLDWGGSGLRRSFLNSRPAWLHPFNVGHIFFITPSHFLIPTASPRSDNLLHTLLTALKA